MEKLAQDRAEKLQHAVSVKTDAPIVIPAKEGFFVLDVPAQQKLQLKTVISLRDDMCKEGEEPLADQIIYTRTR